MKIWFITRSYPPLKGGGPLMRELQVNFLKRKYDVEIITINHNSNEFIQKDGITYIPYTTNKYLKRINIILEMFGIIKDSHTLWIKNVISYLKGKIKDGDIIFSTTGGELACMIIGNEIKKINSNIKHIINYHDLLDYGNYKGERVYKNFHISIDNIEKEILENADFILTNSNVMTEFISDKFSFVKNKIDKLYFGFINNYITINNKVIDNNRKIKIANIGSASYLQSPDILIKAYELLPKNLQEQFELVYIGDANFNKKIKNKNNIITFDYMNREELIKYAVKETDYAFVSLINIIPFKPAMPTKFYEYIGLELPIIGVLPENSEASQVIKKYGFGYNCVHGDIECLKKILVNIANNKDKYEYFKSNLRKYKNLFNSENTLKTMYDVVENLKNAN